MNSIGCFCSLIKDKTGRTVCSGAVTYAGKNRDTPTINPFSLDQNSLAQFLEKQQINNTVEFVDRPEDLKNALNEAIKFDWREDYKVVIIFAASACHGKIYQHPSKFRSFYFFGKKYDDKPDDTIDDIIKKLIEKNIAVVGISYTDETALMYIEIQKIFKTNKSEHKFYLLKIQNMSQQEVTKGFNQAIEHLIGMNISTTKTMKNQIERLSTFQRGLEDMKQMKQKIYEYYKQFTEYFKSDEIKKAEEDKVKFEQEIQNKQKAFLNGPLQALHQKGDIEIFESKVRAVNFECTVYKVGFRFGCFDEKKNKIFEIKFTDFTVGTQQTIWKCTRTETPYAKGMMKEVYIIKNTESHVLYAGKVPIKKKYKTIEEVVLDNKSHFIAKALMEEFMTKSQRIRLQKKYPEIFYTDLLILEEIQSNQVINYYVAEKFMGGEFKKYNNNDAFVLDENTIENRLAQTFSLYTFFASNENYVVQDVQGVGNAYTDPAINSIQGNFDETDETDNGEKGISNFMTSLKQKKLFCKDILDELKIKFP